MNDCSTAIDARTSEMVPDAWPPITREAPRPTLKIRGLVALPGMVLLWFMPKRVGACLAGAGWRPAIVAHLLSLTLGLGLAYWMEHIVPLYNPKSAMFFDLPPRPFPEMPIGEMLRLPFASLVISVHGGTATTAGVMQFLAMLGGLEIALVVVALAMMPYAAAGETARRLFGRCLRLTWWSLTILIPLGFGWLLDPWWRATIGLSNAWHSIDYMMLALAGVWWLMVLLRSGYRYAGPAEGPAWEPRTPRCESCGYIIARLATTGRCPECGRPIADSLPGRRATVSPIRLGRFGSLKSFRPRVHAVFKDEAFFDRLSVHHGHARARARLLSTCAVCVILACFGIPSVALAFPGVLDVVPVNHLADVVSIGCATFFGFVVFSGIASLAVSAIGRRPVQPSAVASFYALSALAPLALLPIFISAMWLLAGFLVEDDVGRSGVLRAGAILLASLAIAGGLWVIARTVRIFRSMLRDTRYANG